MACGALLTAQSSACVAWRGAGLGRGVARRGLQVCCLLRGGPLGSRQHGALAFSGTPRSTAARLASHACHKDYRAAPGPRPPAESKQPSLSAIPLPERGAFYIDVAGFVPCLISPSMTRAGRRKSFWYSCTSLRVCRVALRRDQWSWNAPITTGIPLALAPRYTIIPQC